jgi:hypothetical protein
MTWNNEKKKKSIDSFWLGFIPSFLLPFLLLIIIFKIKYTTQLPIFEAIWKFSQTGLMGKDMISSVIPSLLLFFIFHKLDKDKASKGAFVGMVPFLILTFLVF